MLNADWIYDSQVIAQIRFAPIAISVTANICNLVEKNIAVPLKRIMANDIVDGYSDVVSGDSFKIQLEQCVAGIKLDYKFTTAGSTDVSGNSDILKIASGNDAAEGVGLQILDSNNNVLKSDQDHNTVAQTSDRQSVTTPLKVRYVQTGIARAGKVDSVATFNVFYRQPRVACVFAGFSFQHSSPIYQPSLFIWLFFNPSVLVGARIACYLARASNIMLPL